MSQDKESLIGKANLNLQAKQNKELIHYFPPEGGCLAPFLEIRTSSCLTDTWEDKCHNSKCSSTLLLLFPTFIAEYIVLRPETSLWLVWVSCPGCVPIQFVVHTLTTSWWGRNRTSNGLNAVSALLSKIQNITPGTLSFLWHVCGNKGVELFRWSCNCNSTTLGRRQCMKAKHSSSLI